MTQENEDDRDALPEVLPPEPTPEEARRVHKTSDEPRRRMNTLGMYRSSQLARALEPLVKRVPNADGTFADDPKFGVSEFVDPAMTYETAAAQLQPTLSFVITWSNIKGIMEVFYGRPRLQKEPRKRKPKDPKGSALTADQAADLHTIPYLTEVVSKLAEQVHKLQGKVQPKLDLYASRVDALKQLIDEQGRDVRSLKETVARLDRTTVKKASEGDLEAAFSTAGSKVSETREARLNRLYNRSKK